MNGLELSRGFYHEVLEPRIRSDCPQSMDRIAAGLFGHGSQCLGFDDDISRDHDWGPRACILLNDEDYLSLGPGLKNVLGNAPEEYRGFRVSHDWLGPRGGVLNTREWFTGLLGGRAIPARPADWLPIQEHELLWATNGEIWHDGPGEVAGLRKYLGYYPEEVWKKRLAEKCAAIDQSGANVERSLARKDTVAAWLSLGRLASQVMQVWFLLNREYAPFYKWLSRAFSQLPDLPGGLSEDILLLADRGSACDGQETVRRILQVTRHAIDERFPSVMECGRFHQVANRIYEGIEDPEIRSSSIWDGVSP